MLLLNRKSKIICVASPCSGIISLTLDNLEGSKLRSLKFQISKSYISQKTAGLAHVLLLKTNSKADTGSSAALSDLTLSDREWSKATTFLIL